MNLLTAAFVGQVGDACSIRRPARHLGIVLTSADGLVVRTVCVDDPQVLVALVGHDIVEMSDVSNSVAIGRDLGVRGELQFEMSMG